MGTIPFYFDRYRFLFTMMGTIPFYFDRGQPFVTSWGKLRSFLAHTLIEKADALHASAHPR